jgi:hypothetical protein
MFAVYPNVHVVTGTDELITNRLPLRPRVGSTSTPTPPTASPENDFAQQN